MVGDEEVKRKLRSFAHPDYAITVLNQWSKSKKLMQEGKDIFEREKYSYSYVDDENSMRIYDEKILNLIQNNPFFKLDE